MSQNSHTPHELLERCIVENSSEAWAAFLRAYAGVIRRVYHAHAHAAVYPEFETWFPGWLYQERKLHSAYRAIAAKVGSGECQTAASQKEYLANYLARIVRTAAAEFRLEQSQPATQRATDSFLSRIPLAAPNEGDDLHARVVAVLPRLPPDLRLPFCLRYFRVFGSLSAEDAIWVAERSGLTAECVVEVVAREADENRAYDKPLSSGFIGSLLDIPPCADGRYSTVDQRVRRAILRIREYLAQSDEGEGA